MKNEVYNELRKNIKLRKAIGEYLDVRDETVYRSAVRKAPILSQYPIVRIIMQYTGWSEEEIFEFQYDE